MSSEELSGGVAPENSMAALLDAETAAYPELRRGEIIEGVVVGTDRDGILVDIGAKSEGVVPPQEMHCLQPEGPSSLNSGDKVLVFIVQPESQEGQIILSLDRARGERGWRVLQDYMDQNQAFEGYITGSNKGGLLVNVEGVNGFVPLSQIVSGPDRSSPENTQRALTEWVGRNITLKVIELNRRRNRAILSERSAVQEKRAAEKERLLLELQEGDVREGKITSIRDFGIFVDIGGADGLVHLSELSWERTPKSPHDLFKVGDEVPVFVLKIDQEAKKIALSVRRAQPERWEEIVSQYREGQIVPGLITKLAPFGAFVRLEGPIEGLIHISELVDRRINHPKEVVEEGDVVPVKIVRIEYERHRLGLSLRQARERAEEDGWAFSDSGTPTAVPQDALDRLGLDAAPVRKPAEEIEIEADSATEASAEEAPVAEVAAGEEPVAVEQAADEAAQAVDVQAESEGSLEPQAAVDAEAVADEPVVETVDEPVAGSEDVAAPEPPAGDAVEVLESQSEAVQGESEPPAAIDAASPADEPSDDDESAVVSEEPVLTEEPPAGVEEDVAPEEEPVLTEELPADVEEDVAPEEEPVLTEEPPAGVEEGAAPEEEPAGAVQSVAESPEPALELESEGEAPADSAPESEASSTENDVTEQTPDALNTVDEN